MTGILTTFREAARLDQTSSCANVLNSGSSHDGSEEVEYSSESDLHSDRNLKGVVDWRTKCCVFGESHSTLTLAVYILCPTFDLTIIKAVG